MDALEMQALFQKRYSYENVPVRPGEMSPRDRFLAIMSGAHYDRIIDCEFGYWDDTLRRWHSEGLPREVDTNDKADIFFGFDVWQKSIPIDVFLRPGFDEEIIERTDRYIVKYDGRRVKCQVFADGTDTIPHYLDFPIKDRESYLPFKERFRYAAGSRVPHDIADIARTVRDRNYMLGVFSGSTAGWLRDLMGFEGFSINICMQPDLVDEMLSDLGDLFYNLAVELTQSTDIDIVAWWEDIAFKTGPICSPEWFMEKCGAVYKRTMDVYRAHGARHSYVDCDGDNRLLVPTWTSNGVDIIFPLEVNAGVHPESLRKKYPGVRMMGGFDKVVLLQGKEAIRKEFKRLKPLVDEGGFIPHVDHRVQADVSYRDYLYYLEVKRDMFGISNRILDR
jgi:uroporphyrinogen decarboxylase